MFGGCRIQYSTGVSLDWSNLAGISTGGVRSSVTADNDPSSHRIGHGDCGWQGSTGEISLMSCLFCDDDEATSEPIPEGFVTNCRNCGLVMLTDRSTARPLAMEDRRLLAWHFREDKKPRTMIHLHQYEQLLESLRSKEDADLLNAEL